MTRHFEQATTFKVALWGALIVGVVAIGWLAKPANPPVSHLKAAGPPGSFVLATASVVQSSSPSDSVAKQRYEEALLECRRLAKELRLISVKFFDSSLAESYEWKEKWPVAAKALSDHRSVFEEAALEWFFECEKPSAELLQLGSAISGQVYERGDMELSWKILTKVKQFYSEPDDIMLNQRIAQVGLRSNRYEVVKDFLEMPGARESVGELEETLDKNLFSIAPRMLVTWREEMEIRKKEAEADDLPRVKFELSNGGEAVLELFENEAPETVANFIALVESGFYEDALFHPVIKGLAAQTGMYNRSSNAQIDYVIKNESREPNARRHFAGSLSMATGKNGKDAGSTLFAITLVPNPDLDWSGDPEDEISQTVFGRVASGLEHLAAMPATIEIDEETQEEKMVPGMNPAEAGFIQKATVIRKRDHEYTYQKIRRKSDDNGK
jgi:cyclophilin family peptidyl-prolyl cis-trans isomerase